MSWLKRQILQLGVDMYDHLAEHKGQIDYWKMGERAEHPSAGRRSKGRRKRASVVTDHDHLSGSANPHGGHVPPGRGAGMTHAGIANTIGGLLARVAAQLQRPELFRRLAVESDHDSRSSRNPESNVCLSLHGEPRAPMVIKGRLEVDRESGEFVIRPFEVEVEVDGRCDDPKRCHPSSVGTASADTPEAAA